MKKLLSIAILFLANQLFAQVEDHFANPDSKWYVVKAFPNGSMEYPSFVGKRTFVYGFNGDSLINNETWLKMYSTEDENFQSDLEFEGYIHSQNGIVRLMNSELNVDTLYKFNLTAGDYVNYEFIQNEQSYLEIQSVTSISISGENHDFFSFDEPVIINSFAHSSEKWIEGIGSIHGPLYPLNPTMFSSELPDSLILSCTKTNGSDYYSHSGFSECYEYSLVAVDKIENELFSAFPNPFTDELNVNLNVTDFERLELKNFNGQIVYWSNDSTKDISISTNGLSSGVYFLTVVTATENQSVKLIK